MMHRLEIPRGRKSDAPAIIKQAIRFGRRLRRRGIHNYVFPSLLDDGATVCKVDVGRRVVNIFPDGSFTASLRDRNRSFERGAFVAQSNRMHAIFLGMAGSARQRGQKSYARADIELATQERRYHECTSSI